MVRDALRSYLSLASGLADVPRQQAVRVAKALVSQGEATAGQTGSIAEDLMGTSRANRDALLQLIRHEVDRGLSRLGLAAADDVRDLREQVAALEKEVEALRASGSGKAAAARRGKTGAAVSAPTKRTASKASGTRTASASAKGAGSGKGAGSATGASGKGARKASGGAAARGADDAAPRENGSTR